MPIKIVCIHHSGKFHHALSQLILLCPTGYRFSVFFFFPPNITFAALELHKMEYPDIFLHSLAQNNACEKSSMLMCLSVIQSFFPLSLLSIVYIPQFAYPFSCRWTFGLNVMIMKNATMNIHV